MLSDNLIKKLSILLLVIVLLVFSFSYTAFYFKREGYEEAMAAWMIEKDKLEVKLKQMEDKSSIVTTEVVTKYVDRVKVIKEKAKEIYVEVPKIITIEDDSKCIINNGFVRLWNETNTGEYNPVSETASGIDGETSEVRLSDVASQHITEMTHCKVAEERLNSLQDWLTSQCGIYECK